MERGGGYEGKEERMVEYVTGEWKMGERTRQIWRLTVGPQERCGRPEAKVERDCED